MKKILLLSLLVSLSINTVWSQQVDHVLGEILIRPLDGQDMNQIASRHIFLNEVHTGINIKSCVSKNLDIWLIRFNFATINEFTFLTKIQNDPSVRSAQFNHLVESRATIPNDPLLSNQWQWINGNDADVDAELAWDIATGGLTTQGDEIVVAVLDDGTNLNHPDLMANHWTNTQEIPNNGIDDDGNGYVDDFNGWSIITDDDNVSGGSHGINCNGMVGAVGNDGNQGTGINWSVKIMTVKNNFNTNEAAVLEAYDYPLTMRKLYNSTGGAKGAYVVSTNASWGIDGGNPANAPLWCQMYDTLGFYGVLNCGATTNATVDVDVVGDLPTACPSDFMIAVTRTDNNDNQSAGYGITTIDLAAPGVSIYTTSGASGYTTTTGTSFASPLTAGVIALMYSVPCDELITLSKTDPEAAALQVRMHLFNGVDPILPGRVVTGGRVNAFNSCQLVVDNCTTTSSCMSILNLSGPVVNTTTTENASVEIVSTQVIDGMSNITYEAGNNIQLLPGFQVQDGGQFLAHIVNCSNGPINLTENDREDTFKLKFRKEFLTLSDEQSIALSFELETESTVTFIITDSFGNVVKEYDVEKLSKGVHNKTFFLDGLSEDSTYVLSFLTK